MSPDARVSFVPVLVRHLESALERGLESGPDHENALDALPLSAFERLVAESCDGRDVDALPMLRGLPPEVVRSIFARLVAWGAVRFVPARITVVEDDLVA
jgi:hypothetical protein